MKLTAEEMLNMRADRDYLAELACATEMPDIPESIRQRA